jgi:hypothetical protein
MKKAVAIDATTKPTEAKLVINHVENTEQKTIALKVFIFPNKSDIFPTDLVAKKERVPAIE